MRRTSLVSTRAAGLRSTPIAVLACACLLLILGLPSAALGQAAECDSETDSGQRLKCKHDKLLDEQDALVGKMQPFVDADLITQAEFERLGRAKNRARGAAERADAKHFKKLSKKNQKICDEYAELLGDGKGNDDGICEPGETCEEVLGDGIGNDDGACKLKGANREACVQIGDCAGAGDELEDETDEGSQEEWETAYDDAISQFAEANAAIETAGPALASRVNRLLTASNPAAACEASIDWFEYGQILAVTIAKQLTVGTRGIADVAERGCDQTVAGFSGSGVCAALEAVASVAAVFTETLEGILAIVDWGIQNTTDSCLESLSSDLQDALGQIALIKAAASSTEANTAMLLIELDGHRTDLDDHRGDLASHDTGVQGHLDAIDDVLAALREDQRVAFFAAIEEALRKPDCIPTIWLPVAQGGMLELVRDHVAAVLGQALASADPTCDVNQAQKHLDAADGLIAGGEYLKGCQRLTLAMQALTK